MFDHPNSQVLAATAGKYGFHTKNDLHVCFNSAISKAKQKNLHKLTAHPSIELGGRLNMDISSVQNSSYGGDKFWPLIQDYFTSYLWSYFIKAKSDLPDTMLDWLKFVQKEINLNVPSICLDNSGENKSFHKIIIKSEFNIKFEFTATGTPQQNGKVECAFATLFGKTRSMLKAARVTIPLRKGLWENCANLSEQLENIFVKEKDQQLAAEMVYGTNPKRMSNIRIFGEMAIISRHSDK
jgi:hypothetical protein